MCQLVMVTSVNVLRRLEGRKCTFTRRRAACGWNVAHFKRKLRKTRRGRLNMRCFKQSPYC